MKQFKKLSILMIVPFLLSGCEIPQEEVPPSKGEVTAHFVGIIPSAQEGGYDITLDFNDDYFKQSATKRSDELTKLSFAAAMAQSGLESKSFYTQMGFSNVHVEWATPSEDTIGYTFAQKKMNNDHLVAVTIRGFNYGSEWVNNLKMGSEGNHEGFEEKAKDVFSALKDYTSGLYNQHVKYWISGYSRGGGVANVLASLLMKPDSRIKTNQNDLYVYTYEAPRGLTEENAVKYPNVFNFVNDLDLVQMVAPAQYGLYRCGQDIIINENKDIDASVSAFDPNITLPVFTPSDDYGTTHKEFVDYVMNTLLEPVEGYQEYGLCTREDFAKRYQEPLGYTISLVFTLPSQTIDKIINTIKNMGIWEMMSLISDELGFYNVIKPIFDEDGISYDDAKLKATSTSLCHLIQAKLILVLLALLDENSQANFTRTIYMHSPEVVWALIK